MGTSPTQIEREKPQQAKEIICTAKAYLIKIARNKKECFMDARDLREIVQAIKELNRELVSIRESVDNIERQIVPYRPPARLPLPK